VRQQEELGEQHRAGLDRALFQLSTAWFKTDDQKSEELLQKILRDYPTTTTASRAMLGLAEVYQQRGDEDKEIEWLRKCVDDPRTEATGRNLMDTDDTRSTAIQRLAVRFEERGQWKEAVTMWTAWQPQSWCGTCHDQMLKRRTFHLVKCHCRLQDHRSAAQAAWASAAGPSLGGSDVIAWSLYILYRDAGQLAELRRAVAAQEQQTRQHWKEKGYFDKLPEAQLEQYLPTRQVSELLETGEEPKWPEGYSAKFDWPKPKRGSLPKLSVIKVSE
jgi:hypothetical protein